MIFSSTHTDCPLAIVLVSASGGLPLFRYFCKSRFSAKVDVAAKAGGGGGRGECGGPQCFKIVKRASGPPAMY